MQEDLICQRVKLCQQGENPYLIHEFKSSFLVVGDHHYHKGYCLLLLKKHVREIHELTIEELQQMSLDLHAASLAVFKAYQPWKVNHMCLGNVDQHIHWHIVPRYEGEPDQKQFPLAAHIRKEINLIDYSHTLEEVAEIVKKIKSCI